MMNIEEFDDDLNFSTEDVGYGLCPNCGHTLNNWGAASRGDGDIFDEIGCDFCEEVIEERHADYCRCESCRSSGGWIDDDWEEDIADDVDQDNLDDEPFFGFDDER